MDEDEVTKRESYAEDNTLDLTGFGDNNMDHGVLYGPQPVSTGLQKKYQDACASLFLSRKACHCSMNTCISH